MTNPLLSLCARATTFPGFPEKLVAACTKVDDWDSLLVQAEAQGLAPLLHRHLNDHAPGICPDRFRRGIRLLFLRHRHVNTLLMQVLAEVLELLGQAGIDVLVLKGAALCQTLYPEIGLRPMRDIDLLVRHEQGAQAEALLIQSGFSTSSAPRPTDHFHLPPLHKNVDGLPICIELHHGLFPDCPPYYHQPSFDDLQKRAISYSLLTTEARTLGNEDMLWHIFNHGVRMPLTYEPVKLISVADIVTLVENRVEEIDWQKVRERYPEVIAALPLLHYLTPWQDRILAKFSWNTVRVPRGVGETFCGWPYRRLKEQREKRLLALLHDTFLPPEWWCRLYYGVQHRWNYYACRCLTHPLHILWWVRLYASFIVPDQGDDKKLTTVQKVLRFQRIVLAIVRKLA